MTRKSRKHPHIDSIIKPCRGTVGYIRLSVRDNDLSGSIENQRLIIEEWGHQQQTPIMHYYVDNGFSGKRFDRPAFQQLLQDISAGKVECVIVKDLSRVGRDHIMVGYYIEEIFPLKNVRFVSVTDQFDTINGLTDQSSPKRAQIQIPLTNVFNEQAVINIKKKTTFALDMSCSWNTGPFG